MPNHLVYRDGQVAHALAGGVIDGVGYRRRRAYDTDLAHALHPERIDLVVLLVDEDHVDRVHIRIDRHVIVGEIVCTVQEQSDWFDNLPISEGGSPQDRPG